MVNPVPSEEPSELPVRTTERDRIGWIVLNRPHARNAITVELARQLHGALTRLSQTSDVIVISGAGGHFSAGGDFHEVEQLRAEGPHALRMLFEAFADACAAIGDLEVPVIAAVQGNAMAGGFELMQTCDIALVAEGAKIADNHSNFGQVPGGGGSQRLPRLIGRQRALAHILTGDRLSGTEAVAWGLAYASAPAAELESEARRLAEQLAGKDRVALGKAKRLVREGLSMSLDDGLAMELATVVEHIGGEAGTAGIEDFRDDTRAANKGADSE